MNPQWDQPTGGELRPDGVHCQRDDARSFFRWDWYLGAVVGNDLVALIPATQPSQPLILTQSMLIGLDDWSRLLSVCQSLGIVPDDGGPAESQRRRDNLDVLQQPARPPTVEPRPGAIAFRGSLRQRDFDELPAGYRQRRRPLRAYVVNAVLGISLLLVLAAISDFIFDDRRVLPTVAGLYAIANWIIARIWSPQSRHRVYYINGFADPSGWVSDFAIHTSEIGWPSLRLVTICSDRIIIRRRESTQLIIVRRDMVQGDPSWQQLIALVRQKLEFQRP